MTLFWCRGKKPVGEQKERVMSGEYDQSTLLCMYGNPLKLYKKGAVRK
jgi:hypothetical protein